MQECEQVVRINDPVRIRHIAHALFFDQMPQELVGLASGKFLRQNRPQRNVKR